MTTEDTHTTTEAPPPEPPPSGYPPLQALRRSRTDRKVAGVSGGLGRHTGIDPLVFRILFVVLAVFGGSGILLYILGWLLVPDEGEVESEAVKVVNRRTNAATATTVILGIVALCLGLIFVGSVADTGVGFGGFGALVVVVVVVLLLARSGPRPAPSPQPYGPVRPPEPGAYGQTPGAAYAAGPATATTMPPPGTSGPVPPPGAPPSYGPPAGAAPPPPPRPPKERSVLGRATVSLALIVVGMLVAWNAATDSDVTVVAILASALLVVGGGLVVGGFAGRARGLIALGILLSLVTSALAVVDEHVEGGIGERDWAPASVVRAERGYRLGIGEGQLDLRRLPGGTDVSMDARVGIGELRIIVPRDATVQVDGHVAAGVVRAQGHRTLEDDDLDVSYTYEPLPGTTPSGTVVTIDAEVGFGELEVRRAAS